MKTALPLKRVLFFFCQTNPPPNPQKAARGGAPRPSPPNRARRNGIYNPHGLPPHGRKGNDHVVFLSPGAGVSPSSFDGETAGSAPPSHNKPPPLPSRFPGGPHHCDYFYYYVSGLPYTPRLHPTLPCVRFPEPAPCSLMCVHCPVVTTLTVASSSSLRLREICTRIRRGTCETRADGERGKNII